MHKYRNLKDIFMEKLCTVEWKGPIKTSRYILHNTIQCRLAHCCLSKNKEGDEQLPDLCIPSPSVGPVCVSVCIAVCAALPPRLRLAWDNRSGIMVIYILSRLVKGTAAVSRRTKEGPYCIVKAKFGRSSPINNHRILFPLFLHNRYCP